MNKYEAYRSALAGPELLVSAGVYDALSARLAANAGFRTISAGGNSGTAGLLAAPDMGQTNMRDMADLYGRICDAVDIPVMVDSDTGYGGVHNVRQAVRAFEKAGAAGITMNDQTFPNRCGYLDGKGIIPVEDMIAKIKAAVDARRNDGLVIVARTDAFHLQGVEAALERCHLYLEAGADVAKPQGVDDEENIVRVVKDLGCPFIATLSSAAGRFELDIPDFERLGAAAVSTPSLSIFAAMMGMQQVLSSVHAEQSLRGIESLLPKLDAYYDAVGLKDYADRESAYRRFAEEVRGRR